MKIKIKTGIGTFFVTTSIVSLKQKFWTYEMKWSSLDKKKKKNTAVLPVKS